MAAEQKVARTVAASSSISARGARSHALADLVRRRRRLPHSEAVRMVGQEVVLIARSRGLVRLEGFGHHAELVAGRGISMFDPD